VFFAVAAGNSADDARYYSPASEPTACTVGATDISDTFAYFSNYGTLVDIEAPGVDITSAWNDGGINTISGTSMATPHVVGLGAYLLALEGAGTTGLCDRIVELATKEVITSLPADTVNSLAYNGATG
jgi:subtilisin family serine protease